MIDNSIWDTAPIQRTNTNYGIPSQAMLYLDPKLLKYTNHFEQGSN